MPKRVFLDTCGWIAVLNARDALHARAGATWQELGQEGCRVVLTDWILAETGNGPARTTARENFALAARRVLTSPNAQVLPVPAGLLTRALAPDSERPDKTWGLVDCASFVVMADADITEAFPTDRHFEQAGFKCLLPVVVGE